LVNLDSITRSWRNCCGWFSWRGRGWRCRRWRRL